HGQGFRRRGGERGVPVDQRYVVPPRVHTLGEERSRDVVARAAELRGLDHDGEVLVRAAVAVADRLPGETAYPLELLHRGSGEPIPSLRVRLERAEAGQGKRRRELVEPPVQAGLNGRVVAGVPVLPERVDAFGDVAATA